MWWANNYAYSTINEFEEALDDDSDMPANPYVSITDPGQVKLQ